MASDPFGIGNPMPNTTGSYLTTTRFCNCVNGRNGVCCQERQPTYLPGVIGPLTPPQTRTAASTAVDWKWQTQTPCERDGHNFDPTLDATEKALLFLSQVREDDPALMAEPCEPDERTPCQRDGHDYEPRLIENGEVKTVYCRKCGDAYTL